MHSMISLGYDGYENSSLNRTTAKAPKKSSGQRRTLERKGTF